MTQERPGQASHCQQCNRNDPAVGVLEISGSLQQHVFLRFDWLRLNLVAAGFLTTSHNAKTPGKLRSHAGKDSGSLFIVHRWRRRTRFPLGEHKHWRYAVTRSISRAFWDVNDGPVALHIPLAVSFRVALRNRAEGGEHGKNWCRDCLQVPENRRRRFLFGAGCLIHCRRRTHFGAAMWTKHDGKEAVCLSHPMTEGVSECDSYGPAVGP